MMHDMVDIYRDYGSSKQPEGAYRFPQLSFAVDPLSALVTLVDFLEEFERPSIRYGTCDKEHPDGSKADVSMVTLEYRTACSATKVGLSDDGVLDVAFAMTTDAAVAGKNMFIAKDVPKYFAPSTGYLDLSSIGIKEVQAVAYLDQGSKSSAME